MHPSFDSYLTSLQPQRVDFCQYEHNIGQLIGQNLRTSRLILEKTQKDMAALLSLSVSHYKNYEAGRHILRLHTAAQWASITGCPPFGLFLGTGYSRYNPGNLSIDDVFKFLFTITHLSDPEFYAFIDLCCAATQQMTLQNSYERTAFKQPPMLLMLQDLENSYYNTIADNIRRFRDAAELSQTNMAHYLGISQPMYQMFESKKKNNAWLVYFVPRFQLAFNVDPLVLLYGSKYYDIRLMQNYRLSLINRVILEGGHKLGYLAQVAKILAQYSLEQKLNEVSHYTPS